VIFKKFIYLFPFLIAFSIVNAQRQFFKIDYEVKKQNLTELQIEKKESITKKDCLKYHCKKGVKLSFCNNNSDENYAYFEELGIIKNSNLSVILKTTHNEELYILVNQDECNTVTLKGFPLKIDESNHYVIYNNPSTDQPYIIQIITIANGIPDIQDEIILPNYIKPKRLLRIKNSDAFILDDKNQIWKTTIKE